MANDEQTVPLTEEFSDTVTFHDVKETMHPQLVEIITDYISADTQAVTNLNEFLPIEMPYNCLFPANSVIIAALSIKGPRDVNTKVTVGQVEITITVSVTLLGDNNTDSYYLKIKAERSQDKFVGPYFIKYMKCSTRTNSSNMRQEQLQYQDGVKDGLHKVVMRGSGGVPSNTAGEANEGKDKAETSDVWIGYEIERQYSVGKLHSLTNTHIKKLNHGWFFRYSYNTIFSDNGQIASDKVTTDVVREDKY